MITRNALVEVRGVLAELQDRSLTTPQAERLDLFLFLITSALGGGDADWFADVTSELSLVEWSSMSATAQKVSATPTGDAIERLIDAITEQIATIDAVPANDDGEGEGDAPMVQEHLAVIRTASLGRSWHLLQPFDLHHQVLECRPNSEFDLRSIPVRSIVEAGIDTSADDAAEGDHDAATDGDGGGGREREEQEDTLALGEPAELRRTPHLDLQADPRLEAGATVAVEVYLDESPAEGDESSRESEGPLPVRVRLAASHHFILDEPPLGELEVRANQARSSSATFTISVVDDPDLDSAAWVSATFAYRHRPSGFVRRSVAIGRRAVPVTVDEAVPDAALIDAEAEPPDLVVEVRRAVGDSSFDVTVETTLLGERTWTGSWALDRSAATMVKQTLESYFAPDAGPEARLASLRGSGFDFFEASPECFQDAWWALVDGNATPASILIVTDEPAFPWELMIPTRGDGIDHEGIGVQCAVGRWPHDQNTSPSTSVPLSDSLVVAPTYTGELVLTHSDDEAKLVADRYQPSERFDPSTFNNIDPWFSGRSASLMHFVGHGQADLRGEQALRLNNEESLLRQQVRATKLKHLCETSRPLVFLNACEAGQALQGLVAPKSLATAFIRLRARAVLAPLWSVSDSVAYAYAKEFYEAVDANPRKPFARIVSDLRAKAYEPSNRKGVDTYAAYCWFGDPLAISA